MGWGFQPFSVPSLVKSMGRKIMSRANRFSPFKWTGRTLKNKRRRFRRMKRRRFIRKKRFQSKYEIKYSNVVDFNAIDSTVLSIANRIVAAKYSLTTNVVQYPLIRCLWPDQGTGKQQMIGSKIFIRKLKVRVIIGFSITNFFTAPIKIMVFKSRKDVWDFNRQTMLNSNNLTWPNLSSDTSWYLFTGMNQTIGSPVFSKLVRTVPTEQEGTVAATSLYYKHVKKSFKINKTFEKVSNAALDPQLNHSDYYIMIIFPEDNSKIGTGVDGIRINAYFTYTDI